MIYIVYPVYFEYDEYENQYWWTETGYEPIAVKQTVEEAQQLISKLTMNSALEMGDEFCAYIKSKYDEKPGVMRDIFNQEENPEVEFLGDDFPDLDEISDLEYYKMYRYLLDEVGLYSYWSI